MGHWVMQRSTALSHFDFRKRSTYRYMSDILCPVISTIIKSEVRLELILIKYRQQKLNGLNMELSLSAFALIDENR